MGYSTTHYTGNAAGFHEDDVHLLSFAYKRAEKFVRETDSRLEKIARGIIAPVVFLGNIAVAPFIYRVDDKYTDETPEYKERMNKIKVMPHPQGFGIIIEYPE